MSLETTETVKKPAGQAAGLDRNQITKIFRSLDVNGDEQITREDIATAFTGMALPFDLDDYDEAVEITKRLRRGGDTQSDSSDTGGIGLEEFAMLVESGRSKRLELFQLIDRDGDGHWSRDDLRDAFSSSFKSTEQLEQFVDRVMSLRETNNGVVSYEEFARWQVIVRADTLHKIVEDFCLTEDTIPPRDVRPKAHSITNMQQLGLMAAGALGGAFSRTLTAPLERLKTLYQTGAAKAGFSKEIKHIINSQGVASLWRGNLANCIKIAPAKALKFALYESVRQRVCVNPAKPTLFEGFVSGSSVAATALVLVHPIDTVKTKMSLYDKKTPLSAASHIKRIWEKGGTAGFFRGMFPALMGSVPFSGVNLATFFYTRDLCMERLPAAKTAPTYVLLGCSVTSTLAAQVVAYPFMPMKANIQAGYDNSLMESAQRIIRERGFLGLYRGMSLNFIKSAPTVAITFTTYEHAREWLKIS